MAPLPAWPPATRCPTPDADEAHLWCSSLDLPPASVQALERTLSPDEMARAGRYRFARDRRHFIAARGLLRSLLGGYLDLDPAAVRFQYNEWGKPASAVPGGDRAIHFNLSHSGGLVLYGVSWGREVGVDLEIARDDIAASGVAERFFSPRESAALYALPAPARCAAFFRCWTRKEAYIKARGEGLSIPLDSFDVSLSPDEPAALLSSSDGPAECERWSLFDVDPAPGYAAALAVEGRIQRLHSWRFAL